MAYAEQMHAGDSPAEEHSLQESLMHEMTARRRKAGASSPRDGRRTSVAEPPMADGHSSGLAATRSRKRRARCVHRPRDRVRARRNGGADVLPPGRDDRDGSRAAQRDAAKRVTGFASCVGQVVRYLPRFITRPRADEAAFAPGDRRRFCARTFSIRLVLYQAGFNCSLTSKTGRPLPGIGWSSCLK